jgi:hypothetical protein
MSGGDATQQACKKGWTENVHELLRNHGKGRLAIGVLSEIICCEVTRIGLRVICQGAGDYRPVGSTP